MANRRRKHVPISEYKQSSMHSYAQLIWSFTSCNMLYTCYMWIHVISDSDDSVRMIDSIIICLGGSIGLLKKEGKHTRPSKISKEQWLEHNSPFWISHAKCSNFEDAPQPRETALLEAHDWVTGCGSKQLCVSTCCMLIQYSAPICHQAPKQARSLDR